MKDKLFYFSVVLFIAGHHLAAAESPSFFFLGNTPAESSGVPLLQREILRQAVSIIGREEFGLIVRDVVLDDPIPEQTALYLSSQIVPEGTNRWVFSLQKPEGTNAIWQGTFCRGNYAELLETAEKAGGLKEALESLQPVVKPTSVARATPA